MRNVLIRVKPGETASDLIAQICELENISHDTPFAFSAIMADDKLKINCLIDRENPYSPSTLISELFQTESKGTVRYVMPPLDLYITTFMPMLHKMVNKVYPYYKKLIPDKEDLMSILYLSIVKLYNKGYYLHNRLIYRSFVNDLNMEVRKLKNFSDICSLDAEIEGEDGQNTTLLDLLRCEASSDEAYRQYHYTIEDYWEDEFIKVKETMLKDMSQLSFDRILIQLKTKTVTRDTSHILSKYRRILNPGYSPRPNAAGDNHYSRRK